MTRSHRDELIVLALFGGGLILLLETIAAGLLLVPDGAKIPGWAENVLVAMATGGLLKMGDVLSALVALSSGRQIEAFGDKLASSSPGEVSSVTAADGAREAADAADRKAQQIEASVPDDPEGEAR